MDNFETFYKAKENAENILKRPLTETEGQMLLLGVIHGHRDGVEEGFKKTLEVHQKHTNRFNNKVINR